MSIDSSPSSESHEMGPGIGFMPICTTSWSSLFPVSAIINNWTNLIIRLLIIIW